MRPDVADLAKAIQLALAPVLLLSGIAALLGVMTGRLARIIDRGRAFAEGRVRSLSPDHVSIALERQNLEPRRHLTSSAITTTTIAALMVCVVIASLFLEVMLQTPLKWFIGTLFAAAMSSLVVGLTFFLREVHLAMRTVRIAVTHTPWTPTGATTSPMQATTPACSVPSVRTCAAATRARPL
jgi:hypothetical protein